MHLLLKIAFLNVHKVRLQTLFDTEPLMPNFLEIHEKLTVKMNCLEIKHKMVKERLNVIKLELRLALAEVNTLHKIMEAD